MKIAKYTLIPLLAAFVMAGCKEDDNTPQQPTGSDGFTVTASVEGNLGTAWEPGDEIKVVCGDEIYTFVTAAGGATATFTSKDDNLSAAMVGSNPVTGYANCSSMFGTFRIQTEQQVNDGVNAARVPMFAYTMTGPSANNLNLTFKPLGSLLELDIEPYDIVAEKLTITPSQGAVVSGGAMAGGYTIDAAKSLVVLTNPVNSITLNFAGGMDFIDGASLKIPVGWFAIEGGLDLVFQQGTKTYISSIWAEDGLVKTFGDGTGFKQAKRMSANYEFDDSALPRAYYVKADASNSSKGISWEAPTTLSYAISKAASGSVIHIAAGTYNPTIALTGRDAADQTNSFEINTNVTLLGGYPSDAAAGATADPAANKTILDGANKSYHTVVVCAPKTAGEKVVLNGITIKGGAATSEGGSTIVNGATLADNYGGGIALVNTEVEMTACTISDNIGINGAGLYSAKSKVKVTGCTISTNTATAIGGGVHIASGCELTMATTTITANSAATAGGLYLNAASGQTLTAAISGATLSNNTSTFTAAALYVHDESGNQALESSFTNCTITGSTMTGTGDFGGTLKVLNARTSFTGCRIYSNTTSNNGLCCVTTSGTGSSHVVFESCAFSANASGLGACIYAYNNGGSMDLFTFNSTFSGNTATTRGGALYARNAVTNDVRVTCVNTTFSGNQGTAGGAFEMYTANENTKIVSTLISCTITNNTNTNGAVCLENKGITLKTYNTIVSGNSTSDVAIGTTAAPSPTGTSAFHYNSLIGTKFYDAANTMQTVTPTFDPATMLSALADNGGSTQTCKLVGGSATNPAFGNGMTQTALKAMATTDISADILGVDQTGTARTDAAKIIGACVK